uniref:Uncharacterized protein n=1 Tax=Arundo donax TaxID=35708 RepID=A0A0A9FMP5_ARUDO
MRTPMSSSSTYLPIFSPISLNPLLLPCWR